MKFVFISDFFVNEISGGGEINNEELVTSLIKRGHDVVEIKCSHVTPEYITNNSECCFVVSNFVYLLEEVRTSLKDANYVIYEHDHKYVNRRNPALFKGYRAPNSEIVNKEFYHKAQAVLCQSKFHCDIVYKNLHLRNLVNLGGNIWSEKSLLLIEKLLENKKKQRFSVMNSDIPHKNTLGAIKYCKNMNAEYELVSSDDYNEFLSKLGSNNKFVFLPKTPETLSRLLVEARMLGMEVHTNDLSGATHEPWFQLKGLDLINKMRAKREKITNVLEKAFSKENKHFLLQEKLVSVVMPAYNDEKYVAEALDDLLAQSYTNIEIIIVDDGSTDKTASICKEYADSYDIISFYQKENGGTGSALNRGFEEASGAYGTWVSSDDRREPKSIAKLVEALENKDVDIAFSAYHSQRFDRPWRSYTPSDDKLGYKWEVDGFAHSTRPSGKVFVVDNWVDINLDHCHSGVSFLFTMDLKRSAGKYLTMPGEDYHMEVKMGMLAKDNKVAYLDEVLGWHRFPATSLTSMDSSCTHEAENITKNMIRTWKETGQIDG